MVATSESGREAFQLCFIDLAGFLASSCILIACVSAGLRNVRFLSLLTCCSLRSLPMPGVSRRGEEGAWVRERWFICTTATIQGLAYVGRREVADLVAS
jgi:hypothetical protein